MRKKKPQARSRDIGKDNQKTRPDVAKDSTGVLSEPDDSHDRERKTPHRLREITSDVVKGFLIILIVLSINLLIERTEFGKDMELMGYGFLQKQLSSRPAPVTIVDISDLTQKDYVVQGRTVRATPRQPLQEMIQALAEQKPKSIGIAG